MEFSLILATLNRSKEIRECLNSLVNQVYKDFEVIIVDQSNDTLTKKVVDEFDSLCIQYHHVNFKGLSKARNFGLKYANGAFSCLLDDDAIYTAEYLKVAKDLIDKYGEVVLSGVILSVDDHKTPFVEYKDDEDEKEVAVKGIVNSCPSAAIVFSTKSISLCGGFDERLGVGTCYSAGEETDFLLRQHDKGFKIIFSKKMIVYHPIKPIISIETVYNHYLGKGALFKIDLLKRKKIRLISLLIKNTIGMYIKACILDKKNKNIYLNRKNGFLDGIRTFEL